MTSAKSRSTPNAPSRLAYSRKSVRRAPSSAARSRRRRPGRRVGIRAGRRRARGRRTAPRPSMDLAGGGTGTPVARGGAWGRQPRSETNARRDASRTRDSKRSYRSEPAVSGWRVEVASGPTSVGRTHARARAVRACAKSTSWSRSPFAGHDGRGRRGGRAIQGERERVDRRVDVGRDGRRTTTAEDERGEGEARARRHEGDSSGGGRTCDTSGVTPDRSGGIIATHSANAPAHRRTARAFVVDDDESSCCSATRIFFGERGGRSDEGIGRHRHAKWWRRPPSIRRTETRCHDAETRAFSTRDAIALARLTLPPVARFSTGSRTP